MRVIYCPVCQSTDSSTHTHKVEGSKIRFYIQCNSCDSRTADYYHEKNAIVDWNRGIVE